MGNITNTPGKYSATVTNAEIGFWDSDQNKPVIKLTLADESGASVEHILRLYAGAFSRAVETLKKAFNYSFPSDPQEIIGKPCQVVTEDVWNDQKQRTYYEVRWINPVSKPLAQAPASILQKLAAQAKALPPPAPRTPRAGTPAPAPRPAVRPAPRNDFADDEAPPF